MTAILGTLGASAAMALAATGFAVTPAAAQAGPSAGQNCTSPPGLNYMICNGQRVPKPTSRVVRPDGSWREEIRQGNCVTVKEKTAQGEYKETRQCN